MFKTHKDIDLEATSITETFIGDPPPGPTEPIALEQLQSESSPPADDATPAQVRQYLTTVLHELVGDETPSGVTPAGLADKWEYGRGEELRQYDEDMFQTIFGPELGKVLGKEIKQRYADGKPKEEHIKGAARWWAVAAVVLFTTILGVLVSWAIYGFLTYFPEHKDSEHYYMLYFIVTLVSIALGSFCVIMLALVACGMCFDDGSRSWVKSKGKKPDAEVPLLASEEGRHSPEPNDL